MESKIPGLKQIIEEKDPDGKTRFVFDIDDDRSDEFFAQFGLQPGDEAGFEALVIEAINNFVKGGSDEGRA
jgi:hypothetical protein